MTKKYTKEYRSKKYSFIVEFAGVSGVGKSTICSVLDKKNNLKSIELASYCARSSLAKLIYKALNHGRYIFLKRKNIKDNIKDYELLNREFLRSVLNSNFTEADVKKLKEVVIFYQFSWMNQLIENIYFCRKFDLGLGGRYGYYVDEGYISRIGYLYQYDLDQAEKALRSVNSKMRPDIVIFCELNTSENEKRIQERSKKTMHTLLMSDEESDRHNKNIEAIHDVFFDTVKIAQRVWEDVQFLRLDMSNSSEINEAIILNALADFVMESENG